MSDLCCIVAVGFLLMGAAEGIINGLAQAGPEARWTLTVATFSTGVAAVGGTGAGLLVGEAWGGTVGLGAGLLSGAVLCPVLVVTCAALEAVRQRRQR